ncbi:FadR/GntR family transcriptional regulator [Lampropedia puyangensis]|nr:FadR/GntR family transcriptional regulator [Lampropedia puyangensis]
MTRLANTAAFTLQQRIMRGEYAAGEFLPPQRSLADELDISRASLREALSMLETLGLVQMLPGKGTRVHALNEAAPSLGRAFALPSQTLHLSNAHLMELRLVVEPAWAALAARHSTPDTVAELEKVQQEYAHALSQCDLQKATQFDLRFHLLLAQQSGNPALHTLFTHLEAAILYSLQQPYIEMETLQAPMQEHAQIIHAIAAKDERSAATCMRDHLLSAATRSHVNQPSCTNDVPWLLTPI